MGCGSSQGTSRGENYGASNGASNGASIRASNGASNGTSNGAIQGASRSAPGPVRLTRESGFGGRRRLVYEYDGRRHEVTAEFLLHRRRNGVNRSSPGVYPALHPGDKFSQLTVTGVNVAPYLRQIRDEHHTSEYDSKELIVRRGQLFAVDVNFDRSYDKNNDKIFLEFATGNAPSYSKGTRMRFFVSEDLEDAKWGAKIESTNNNMMTLKVQTSCNSLIGYFTLSLFTKVGEEEETEFRFDYPKKVYLIFNPWCETDAVYMEREDEKKEYVLNETGYLFYGNYKNIGKRRWNFGQFDDSVFDAAIYLLQDCSDPVADSERNNPIIVSRKMSAAINVQDDGGVLVGRWDGEFKDGARPTSWNGSVAILEQYMKNKTPVKYGQCWVFSGVLTTILRSLGIPARSVTNYASAHDTDASMTIDYHVDGDGEPIKWMDRDSVWNFHVWNDCWMTRPDLPPGYGGWQAVDSTPQETSEGIFQTGPASLNAIKQGHVYLPYDARFVFAEINGDKVFWEVTETENGDNIKKIRTETSSIGKFLYTKEVGRGKGVDVQEQYKHKEGSMEERLAVETAVQYGSKPDTYSADVHEEDDVIVEMDIVNEDKLFVGDDFEVKVRLSNKSAEQRNVKLTVIVQVCYYTGVLADKVKKERRDVDLGENKFTEAVFEVKVDEYMDKLVDQSAMKIFLMGRVQETKQILVAQDDFLLRTPALDVSVSDTRPKVNQEFTVKIALKNPLPRTLTNCTFNLEGAGLQRTKTIKLNNVCPHGEVKHEVKLKAGKPGSRMLVVGFDSDELSQVHGDVDLDIEQ